LTLDHLARYRTSMCNLYSLTPKEDDVGRFFRVSHNRRAAFKPVNAIFPKHVAPVVRQSEDGEREIVLMSWGSRWRNAAIARSLSGCEGAVGGCRGRSPVRLHHLTQ
jgi:hypothetical protein